MYLFSQFNRMMDRFYLDLSGFWGDIKWMIGRSGRDVLSSYEPIEKEKGMGDPGVLLSSFSHVRVQVVNCG